MSFPYFIDVTILSVNCSLYETYSGALIHIYVSAYAIWDVFDFSSFWIATLYDGNIIDTKQIIVLWSGNSTFTFDFLWNTSGIENGSYLISVMTSTSSYVYSDGYVEILPVGNINTMQGYWTIQEAINNASDGHTIFVSNGIYFENVVVNKSVSLIGEDSSNTVVTGDSGKVMEVVVDNVNLTGFKVQSGFYGVYLNNSSNSRVYGNIVMGHTQGIYLYNSTGNTVFGNNVTEVSLSGIRLWYSPGNIISENNLMSNDCGVNLHHSSNNSISENYIISNEDGLKLNLSPNNVVYGNLINSSIRGIMLDVSSNSDFIENDIAHNENGIFLVHAFDNVFDHNNIVNNTLQVYDFSWDHVGYTPSINTWHNTCEGNFWSDYNGTDLDNNGIGDTPYIIDEDNQDSYPLMNPYWNPGDVNHDLKIDIFDAVLICTAYSSTPSDFNWSCHCDISEPYGLIDIFDVVLMAQSYGEEYIP